jgi:hypothetical protein
MAVMTHSPHDSSPSAPRRLQLRPDRNETGPLLDGGWWPTTTDPIDALGQLLPTLDAWCGAIVAVALSVADWDDHPAYLPGTGTAVPLTWLGLYHNLLIGSCSDRRQIRLLVIPPHSSPAAAAAAMAIALDPANHTPAPGILNRAGCRR